MNRYFDTHTHYNDPRFAGDLQEVLQGIRAVNAAKHLVPGTEYGMQYEDNVQGWQVTAGRL